MGSVSKVPCPVRDHDGARPRQLEAEAHIGELPKLEGRLKQSPSGRANMMGGTVTHMGFDFNLCRDKARLFTLSCLACRYRIPRKVSRWKCGMWMGLEDRRMDW